MSNHSCQPASPADPSRAVRARLIDARRRYAEAADHRFGKVNTDVRSVLDDARAELERHADACQKGEISKAELERSALLYKKRCNRALLLLARAGQHNRRTADRLKRRPATAIKVTRSIECAAPRESRGTTNTRTRGSRRATRAPARSDPDLSEPHPRSQCETPGCSNLAEKRGLNKAGVLKYRKTCETHRRRKVDPRDQLAEFAHDQGFPLPITEFGWEELKWKKAAFEEQLARYTEDGPAASGGVLADSKEAIPDERAMERVIELLRRRESLKKRLDLRQEKELRQKLLILHEANEAELDELESQLGKLPKPA